MGRTKRLKELTIKDNFMFGAVMMDEDNCKGLLERVLEIQIDRVDVSKEKSIVYHPEYKGVRLDVYAKDEKQTRYNVEMQVERKPALGKRSRYYQSQMDMEMLLTGEDYTELPNTYVIFICDFDPFGKDKYRYTFRTTCQESENVDLQKGVLKELQRGEFLRVRIRYSYFCRILERFLKYFRIKLKNKVIWMY